MDCILLSAGLGKRTNLGHPKQFYRINGKPFFIYPLEVLDGHPQVDRILITYHPSYQEEYQRHLEQYAIRKAMLVEGGETRQQSVQNALAHVQSDRVIIHEAARPLISAEFIDELLSYEPEAAIVPTVPVPFTVSMGDGYMTGILDRQLLHNVQLPQIFQTGSLRRAHELARKEGVTATEDGILVFRAGERVRFVRGRESNIKVTTPLDILIINQLLGGTDSL